MARHRGLVGRRAAIVTCKGRLAHLQLTLPALLQLFGGSVVVVDYQCSLGTGEWLLSEFSNELNAGKLRLIRAPGDCRIFNKSRANNLGAGFAISEGAESLFFLDADTLVFPSLVHVWDTVKTGQCSIAARSPSGRSVKGLTGVLAVNSDDFQAVQGYNEEFEGWGGEDVDMRLRLKLDAGCSFSPLPQDALRAIAHPNQLRTQFHQETNIKRNARRNEQKIDAWLRSRTGLRRSEQPADVKRLFFR